MKRTAIILLFSFLAINLVSAINPKTTILGTWRAVSTKDLTSGKTYKHNYMLTYHFLEDGYLIMTDKSFRERTFWDWKISRGILKLKSTIGPAQIMGKIKFKSKNQFILKIYLRKKKGLIRTFERI